MNPAEWEKRENKWIPRCSVSLFLLANVYMTCARVLWVAME